MRFLAASSRRYGKATNNIRAMPLQVGPTLNQHEGPDMVRL